MDSFSEIAEEEWVDCKAVFETALSELSTGQLIQDPRYTMMDLMSAIEVRGPPYSYQVPSYETGIRQLTNCTPEM